MGFGNDDNDLGAGEGDLSVYDEAFRESQALHDLDALDDQDKTLMRLTERLEGIKSAARDGSLRAYGVHREQALKRIQHIRKTQINVFRKHMELELNFPVREANQNFNSKEFSERFQNKFYEKESDMDEISGMLEGLTKVLGHVNADANSANLPKDPSAGHESRNRDGGGGRNSSTPTGNARDGERSNFPTTTGGDRAGGATGNTSAGGATGGAHKRAQAAAARTTGRAMLFANKQNKGKKLQSNAQSNISASERAPWLHQLDLDATSSTASSGGRDRDVAPKDSKVPMRPATTTAASTGVTGSVSEVNAIDKTKSFSPSSERPYSKHGGAATSPALSSPVNAQRVQQQQQRHRRSAHADDEMKGLHQL